MHSVTCTLSKWDKWSSINTKTMKSPSFKFRGRKTFLLKGAHWVASWNSVNFPVMFLHMVMTNGLNKRVLQVSHTNEYSWQVEQWFNLPFAIRNQTLFAIHIQASRYNPGSNNFQQFSQFGYETTTAVLNYMPCTLTLQNPHKLIINNSVCAFNWQPNTCFLKHAQYLLPWQLTFVELYQILWSLLKLMNYVHDRKIHIIPLLFIAPQFITQQRAFTYWWKPKCLRCIRQKTSAIQKSC